MAEISYCHKFLANPCLVAYNEGECRGVLKGRQEGKLEGKVELLFEMNYPISDISNRLGISQEQVKDILHFES